MGNSKRQGIKVKIVATTSYNAYGVITSQTPGFEVFYAYTGRIWDADTGLYNYRTRVYDAGAGRFVSEDWIGFAGGQANLSGYVGNSPTNFTDPSGLQIAGVSEAGGGWFGDALNWTGIGAGRSGGDWLDRNFGGGQSPSGRNLGGKIITGAAMAGSFFPIAGEIGDGSQAIGGYDFAGRPLSGGERVLTGVGACVPIVPGWVVRYGGEVLMGTTVLGVSILGKGGRLGSPWTRRHVREVADGMEARGWTIIGGGGRFPEEYLPGPGGARKGSAYPDITATKNGRTLRVNTVDTLRDCITPTLRERRNANKILGLSPGDHLLIIPKPSTRSLILGTP